MSLFTDTIESRAALLSSPTFAMSLGSKELFHTNFLAFLLSSEDETLESLQHSLRDVLGLPVRNREVAFCAVWREKFDADLIIVPLERAEGDKQDALCLSRTRALVVEAKLKSLPTDTQLKSLAEKKLKRVRLSYPDDDNRDSEGAPDKVTISCTEKANPEKGLVNPDLVLLLPQDGRSPHERWTPRSWKDVATQIQKWANSPDKANGTSDIGSQQDESPAVGSLQDKLRYILRDYASSLLDILRVVHATRTHVMSAWAGRDTVHYQTEFYKPLCDFGPPLRLNDLVGKIGFDCLLSELLGHMKNAPALTGLLDGLESHVSYSNGQPALTFEYRYGKTRHLGVQLQGTHLRHFVSCREIDKELEAALFKDKNLLWEGWICQIVCGQALRGLRNSAPKRLPSTGDGASTSKRLSNLLVYRTERFIYSALNLAANEPESNELTLGEVASGIIGSLQKAQKLSDKAN